MWCRLVIGALVIDLSFPSVVVGLCGKRREKRTVFSQNSQVQVEIVTRFLLLLFILFSSLLATLSSWHCHLASIISWRT